MWKEDHVMNHGPRKDRRVELDYIARILSVSGEMICDCAILNVSQGGARIAVLASEMVPDEFLLTFSASSNVSRRCKVAWRKDEHLGVTFLKVVDATAVRQEVRRKRLLETPCP
jgi:hypothetical protein